MAPGNHLLALVTSRFFVLPLRSSVPSFNRDFPLPLRNCASFRISPSSVLFSALTFSSDPRLHHYRKAEVQRVAKIPFTFNLVLFIDVLNLQFGHRRFMPAINLEIWLIRNLQQDPVLRNTLLRFKCIDIDM